MDANKVLKRLISGLFFTLGGILAGFALVTAAMMLFPGPFLGSTSYYDRPYRAQAMEIEVREYDGDLFVALPGRIRPPAEDRVLERLTIRWDGDGFREPLRRADRYPIVVYGDSFTEGFNVPVPWPDRLAEQLDVPVKNNGYRGYGPVEVARAVQESFVANTHDWMLYAYFAGNDMGDAVRGPKIDVRSPRAVWDGLFNRLSSSRPLNTPDPDAHYDFPMPVIIGGNYYEQAFLSYYLWWNVAPEDGFERSSNFRIVNDSLRTMDAHMGTHSCRALVFIPTKEQLYYRYIYPTERRWLRDVNNKLVIDSEGLIRFVSAPLSEADETDYMARLYSQRDALAQLVNSLPHWRFIDLLPAFDEAAARGEMLYYQYDSHWNQAGHDLAARTIAAALRTAQDCPID